MHCRVEEHRKNRQTSNEEEKVKVREGVGFGKDVCAIGESERDT